MAAPTQGRRGGRSVGGIQDTATSAKLEPAGGSVHNSAVTDQRLEIPLFPLRTVLFPGGRLPLRIFETRYVDMTKSCIADESVFGVCQILEGQETGTPALTTEIGCTARIVEWEVPGAGLFSLVTRGETAFRVVDRRVESSGLIVAQVELLPTPARQNLRDEYKPLGQMVGEIVNQLGSKHFCAPIDTHEAVWVAYRLAEVLPLTVEQKLDLLQQQDGNVMLGHLSRVIERMREESGE